MAKKRKQTEEIELLMPDTKDVINLAKRRRNAKKQVAEISSTIGEAIGAAVEKKHLDHTAFSIACRLDSMSPEKLAITYPHLMRYLQDLNIETRATEQAELFGDEADEPADGKVTPIGGRRVAEAAGSAL